MERPAGEELMAGRIQQIRKSIDAKLDALQAQAEALDAQLASTGREAQQRIDRQKQALRDALDHLKKEFQRQRGVAAETSKNAWDMTPMSAEDATGCLRWKRKKQAAPISVCSFG